MINELNKYLLWFWTLRIGNLVDVLFIITSQFVDKLSSRIITVEKKIILNLLFTVTLIHLKNNWTLQSTLQKWRHKNKVTEKIIKSSSNPGISLCQIIDDKMLWSKFQKWTFRNSHFWTKILNRSSVSIEINLLENWT